MEINKILFSALNAIQQTQGLISQKDVEQSKYVPDITQEVDETSELIQKEETNSVKNLPDTVTVDNTEEFLKQLANSKGTIYLSFTDETNLFDTCFTPEITQKLNNDGSTSYSNIKIDFYKNLYQALAEEVNYQGNKNVQFKIVDGKVVEYNDLSSLDNVNSIAKNKNSMGIDKIDMSGISKLEETNGISYVLLCGDNCSICHSDYMNLIATQKLFENAGINFYSMNFYENEAWARNICFDWGLYNDDELATFPVTLKFVDGEIVQVTEGSIFKGNYQLSSDIIADGLSNSINELDKLKNRGVSPQLCGEDILDVLEEAKQHPNTIKFDKDGNVVEEKVPEDAQEIQPADEQENLNEEDSQLVMKQKLNTLKESIQTEFISNMVQEISENVLKDSIENANSIADLKNAVNTNLSTLDFTVQVNLMSAVNSFESDMDLDKAKEELLKMI